MIFAVLTLSAAIKWIPGEIAFVRYFDIVNPMPGITPGNRLKAEKELLEYRSQSPFAWRLIGDAYLHLDGNVFAAEAAYIKAVELGGEKASIYNSLAETAIKKGDFAKSAEYTKKAFELFPTHPKYREKIKKLQPDIQL
jgi:tetratricopeptide (TPR) repeat protein